MEQLKAFWTYVSTPGSQMPVKDTVIILGITFVLLLLMPQFVQWRAYRRQNPINRSASQVNNKTNAATSVSKGKNTAKTSTSTRTSTKGSSSKPKHKNKG